MKTLLTIITLLASLTASAQKFSETIVEDKVVLAVVMNSENDDYSNVKVMFKTSACETFLDKLIKFGDKVKGWSEKAKKHNVSNYRKPIPGTIDYNHLEFEFDGSKNTSDGYFIVPAFDVDTEGNCFLLLRGYYEGVNTTAIKNSRVAGDKVRYQQMCSFNFYVRIPVEDIDKWLTKLDKANKHLEESQKRHHKINKYFQY